MGKLLMIISLIIYGTLSGAFTAFSEEEFLRKGVEGNISFLSGGIGQNERDFLLEKGKIYPLKLMFSNKKGEYLSNVLVKVYDKNNKMVLSTNSEGPWFFIDLPKGIYHIEANFKGDKKTIPKLQIVKGTQKIISIQW